MATSSKINGTVKWFSNRKGFGFIEPQGSAEHTEDIFVHQTSIVTENEEYRTLSDGMEVEFAIEQEESGKLKAVNVTTPGGGPIKQKKHERKRSGPRRSGGGGDTNGADNVDGAATGGGGATGSKRSEEKKAPATTNGEKKVHIPKLGDPPFHDVITEDGKAKIAAKGVELNRKKTLDVALDDARIKLGQGGYAGIALSSGVVGEGTYVCDEHGIVNFTWERCIKFMEGAWAKVGVDELIQTFSLVDGAIKPVEATETAETLWGTDKGDPRDAFEANEFKMKRVVLTRPPNSGRGGGGRRRGGGGGGK